ncbi:ATP-binding cassette domain-containing protein [Schaalia sp. 19OD2882]|uniref:ABC transporter ATP-binding protein/permease n=1 Tax=Schaalia sp. 19OD2882 TaxID=2794089 RepID=UPI001C1F141D|nr:ATP-binding cassette domain-containing protein [Schaalia sp. 19OD2882]QWW19663.1 ATP-binding cassette domain-containing protein [Schaalia sp. 19OD2882]
MSTRRAGARQRAVFDAAGVSPTILIAPVLTGVASSGALVAGAFVNSMIFSELLGRRSPAALTGLICVLAALLVLIPLLGLLRAHVVNRVGLTLKVNLRRRILADIAERGPMRLSSSRAGALESLMVDGVEAIEPYFGSYIPQIAVTALTAASLCLWIGTVSPIIGVTLFVCATATFLVPRLWDRALAEEGQAHWEAYADLNSDFVDAMMGMETLKSFGASRTYGRRLAARSEELLRTTLSQLRVSLGETGASAAVMVLGPAIALLIASLEVRQGSYGVDRLFFITLLSIEVFRPLRDLANAFHAGYFGLSAATRIHEVFHAERPDVPGSAAVGHDRRALPEGVPADIEASGVSYTYEGATVPALSDASVRIPQGRFLAIIGGSGSGKSTLIGMILGLDSPTEGSITIGGEPTTDVDIPSTISLVPQSPVIFPGTVEEILAAAAPTATRDDMLSALTLAGAHALHETRAATTPSDTGACRDDLELFVEEAGANLSGGQRQRLAIARALVKRPRVLILDESTSALDSHTEARVLSGVRRAFPDMTLVLVTHRMEVAASADRVVRLSRGRIVAVGRPEDVIGPSHEPAPGPAPAASQGIEHR